MGVSWGRVFRILWLGFLIPYPLMMKRFFLFVLAPLVCSAAGPDYSRDILPILSENCFFCHGQDPKARKADLRLDVEADAKRVVDGIAAIVPGKSGQSTIMERMLTHETDDVMPPPKSNRKVTPAQIELIRQWIDSGANWGQHWAFTRVEKPAIPVVPDAAGMVGQGNPIDAFVRAKLVEKKLVPSPRAEPETLLRRLYLDLTGLPPEPAEADAFAAMMRSNDAAARDAAYEKTVDRLLGSPRHGERWVWEWLDAARYADSNGYQGDNDRTAWPWRDWVIHAINANLPYDQFTVWQIAGDLLPGATEEQKLATAFVRNHMINGEGGRIPEENRIEYLFDQVETVGTTWLGLTLQCCRCHDHKYDPLKQTDYYSLVAYFNNTIVDGNGRSGKTAPVLDMSTAAEDERLKKAEERLVRVAADTDAFELKKWPRPEGKTLADTDAAKLPGNLSATLAKVAPAKRNVDGTLEAIGYFKGKDDEYVKVLQRLTNTIRDRDAAANNITKVMVMEDRKQAPRDTFVLNVGAYDAPLQKVGLATPETLPKLEGAAANRLGLAQWIVSRENPLTARVTVNRYWQSLFGIGLVKTAEDFGFQSEIPPHLELLNWLAADFMDNGWDVKRLIKLIVMSETYQQSSKVRGESDAADPDNRMLARGARFRLPSFMIRDQALSLSGLLAPQQGGPSVKPYQPEGIWEEASFGKITYKPGTGSDLYRRSLYTFWRRIVGPTMVFDNASRQVCTVKAARTNTPLQALVTMNETTFVESARGMARRVLREYPGSIDVGQRARYAWKLATLREPDQKELELLIDMFLYFVYSFRNTPAEAEKLLRVGESPRAEYHLAEEQAAWTTLCLMILNTDEVMNKE